MAHFGLVERKTLLNIEAVQWVAAVVPVDDGKDLVEKGETETVVYDGK